MLYNNSTRDVFILILAIDIGNSSVAFGVYEANGRLIFSSKLSTVKSKCRDEYAVMLNGILSMNGIQPDKLDGVVISSVVPPLTSVIADAATRLTSVSPMIVGPGIKTGLNIKIDQHTQLGADIVANTVAAFALTQPPFVVIDMGSATTLTVVNRRGELCGVIIAPGVRQSVDSLSGTAAELPYISLDEPKSFPGKNTADSMKCGIIYGNACMLDGFIAKLERTLEIAPDESLSVIATGGLAECIIPHCEKAADITLAPSLTLDGLYRLYEKNRIQSRH